MWFHEFFSKQQIHLISISGFCTPFIFKIVTVWSFNFTIFFSTNFLARFCYLAKNKFTWCDFTIFFQANFSKFSVIACASYSEFVKLLQAWVLSLISQFHEIFNISIFGGFMLCETIVCCCLCPVEVVLLSCEILKSWPKRKAAHTYLTGAVIMKPAPLCNRI